MPEKIVRRLGERLDHIYQWINSAQAYSSIWDLCCDHGRLGLHLHKRHPHAQVYLVDKIPSIVDKLAADFGWLDDGRLHFLTADACELDIAADNRTLVIVAGVGGQNTVAILQAILARFKAGDRVDFILSPNSHMFELRAFLRSTGFGLMDETFVTEKSFSHEHLWLRYEHADSDASSDLGLQQVSEVGASLWQSMTDIKRTYLHKLIQHYQRMLKHSYSPSIDAAIKAYKRLL